MVISNTTFIQDSTLFIRDLFLSGGVTDPISGTRPSGETFVMTSYPSKPVTYPIISVKNDNITSMPAGMRSEESNRSLSFEVRVWARTEPEKDSLTQQVINRLFSMQTDTTSGAIDFGLTGLKISSAVNVDEPGIGGIHSKVIAVSYDYYTS